MDIGELEELTRRELNGKPGTAKNLADVYLNFKEFVPEAYHAWRRYDAEAQRDGRHRLHEIFAGINDEAAAEAAFQQHKRESQWNTGEATSIGPRGQRGGFRDAENLDRNKDDYGGWS